MINLTLYIYYFNIMIIKDYINRILRLKYIIYIEKFFINYNIIELTIISTLIINNKFYIINNDFVIIEKFHYVY